jgi:hypothetical protein
MKVIKEAIILLILVVGLSISLVPVETIRKSFFPRDFNSSC